MIIVLYGLSLTDQPKKVHVIAEEDESEPLSSAMLNAEAHYYRYKGCVDESGATFRKYVCSTEVKLFNYQLPTYDGIPADPTTRIGMSDQELEELGQNQ